MRRIDRSRILANLRCSRERYLSYHYNPTGTGHGGITKAQFSIPLATGTFIHRGLEELLRGNDVELAVRAAVTEYELMAEKFLTASSVHLDHFDYTVEEQSALVEALIRAYAIVALPKLLDEYVVVGVESEYEWELAPGQIMMSRLDGLLRRRSDSKLEVLSFKTDKGTYLAQKIPDAKLDLQGLSEPLALIMSGKATAADFSGIKMEWLVKGAWKEEPKDSGFHYQDSFLVRPWTRTGPVRGREFAWQYFWPCPNEPHQILGANNRLWTCKGEAGKTHGLGDSWQRVPIWKEMPVKEWIDWLAAQPGALESVLYLPPSIPRAAREYDTALRVIRQLEAEVDNKLYQVSEHLMPGTQIPMVEALDISSPATGGYTGQCNHSFGGTCQFYSLCHNADRQGALIQWADNGFVPRTPHHVGEQEE